MKDVEVKNDENTASLVITFPSQIITFPPTKEVTPPTSCKCLYCEECLHGR
jgi:hypothetical protein